jgi:Na+/H+ antiporter NhaA
MTKQQFWKGLFMLVISMIMTAFGQPQVNYVLIAIAMVAAVLPYVGKNFFVFFTSTTGPSDFSWINVLSGVLIAVGTGLTDYAGQYFIEGVVIWSVLWRAVIGTTLTYVVATFFSPPNSQSQKLL